MTKQNDSFSVLVKDNIRGVSMKETYNDFPFDDIVRDAVPLAKMGHQVFQKFTCSGCGNRLTMETPNVFFEQGTCDKCDAVTDIKKSGCNYMLHAKLK